MLGEQTYMWTVQSKPGSMVSLSIGVPWTSSSVVSHTPQPESLWVVRHTMISYAASLSLNLFIHGRGLMKAMPKGCTKDQSHTSKVLGTSWCAENKDCYFKCIRHTESLHGKDLRIQVNLPKGKNLPFP